MTAAYVVVTLLAATANAYGATVDFARVGWLLDNMSHLGIPRSRVPLLGGLKAAGALGLLVGLAVPPVGVAAGVGLVLFFVGAIVTVLRARWYAHIPYPATFLLLSAASLALRLEA